ncbi:nucleoside deaminase [Sciscionella marina]|uniref:nucleoside deaminase n=1 Tax=Sciscionella marina TaxID=508770 RepID=UPI000381C3C2|nr:nucleoside deaminase [Sciscionella marina]
MLTDINRETEWLGETIRLATESVENGGGPFGALIADSERVIAIGTNRVTANLDPSAHAEVTAIRAACAELGSFTLAGCVLVSSCEPCPMCLTTALWARVDRVLYAGDREDAARAGFDDRAFYELFEKPRSSWDVPVQKVSTVDGFTPFSAWLNHSERIEY